MKTANFPALRVEPALRDAAESVLREGESLSSLIEESVRRTVEHRQIQAEFEARGEAAWQNFQRTGVSYPAAQVHAELRARIDARRAQLIATKAHKSAE